MSRRAKSTVLPAPVAAAANARARAVMLAGLMPALPARVIFQTICSALLVMLLTMRSPFIADSS